MKFVIVLQSEPTIGDRDGGCVGGGFEEGKGGGVGKQGLVSFVDR